MWGRSIGLQQHGRWHGRDAAATPNPSRTQPSFPHVRMVPKTIQPLNTSPVPSSSAPYHGSRSLSRQADVGEEGVFSQAFRQQWASCHSYILTAIPMDYKNQVWHNKIAVALPWKWLANKQPLQATIHRNRELTMQSKKPQARWKWGDGKEFSFPTALPPRYFYQETTTPRFLHRFLRKVHRVGRRGEGTVSFYTSNLAPLACACRHLICLPVLQAVSSSKYKERARIHHQTIPEELVLLSQKSQPARRITC